MGNSPSENILLTKKKVSGNEKSCMKELRDRRRLDIHKSVSLNIFSKFQSFLPKFFPYFKI